MTHNQLADCAGVSRRTLYKWLHPYKDKLHKLGVQPNAKVIPPKAVRFICETFTIVMWVSGGGSVGAVVRIPSGRNGRKKEMTQIYLIHNA